MVWIFGMDLINLLEFSILFLELKNWDLGNKKEDYVNYLFYWISSMIRI